MKRVLDAFRSGTVPIGFLVASVFVAFASIMSFLVVPGSVPPTTEMRIEPREARAKVGDTFVVELVVASEVPVNVFGGEMRFSNDVLSVESINYNTSIADLWVEKPWYENGAGTLNFGGGTTRPGGFVGEGALMKVTFKTEREGTGVLTLHDARILLHDGLGTDTIVETPLDALLTVAGDTVGENALTQTPAGIPYTVVANPPATDINNDGRHTVADVSIFMLHMRGGNTAFDLNGDGSVGVKDLSILMQAVTRE